MPRQEDLFEILNAGVAAVRPSCVFPPLLAQPDSVVSSWVQNPQRYLLALGKASVESTRVILAKVSCADYFILSSYEDPEHSLNVHVGTHPVPDQKSYDSTAKLLNWLDSLRTGALLVILSGGTSALCVHPLKTVGLSSKIKVNDLLIRSGATIQEMNAVRKHLSSVKGGQLAAHVKQLTTCVLAISDVIRDDLSVIGSGPFYPDPSTFLDAKDVLQKYNLWKDVPADVQQTIEAGCAGILRETPKPGALEIPHRIVASNDIARKAAASQAHAAGYRVHDFEHPIHGDVHDAAEILYHQLKKAKERTAIIAGGEVTVRMEGNGTGGRNQHLAMLMAEKLRGQDGVFAAMGTDGVDGNSSAAGAWASGETLKRSGLSAFEKALRNFDSYHYFQSIDQTILTGPTGTNVMDLYIALK